MNFLKNKEIINLIGKVLNIEKKKEALCNDVYFVETEKGKFIIKIANNKIRQDELEKEFLIIEKLKNYIKLPKIFLYKKETNYSFFVMQYINGFSPKNFSDDILEKIATTLKTIHNHTNLNEFVDFDKLLKIAEQNLVDGRLDLDEFMQDGSFVEPSKILSYLKANKPLVKANLLHGDFRPKNMIFCINDLYILDWGLSFVGDPYYDLAIIKWYFSDEEFKKFINYYGIEKIDNERLKYNEHLSAFLNI